MNLVSRSRITLHFGAKAAKKQTKKTKTKNQKERKMPGEETNLMNDFSVVFKERKQERGDKGNEKKPLKEAL